MHSKSAESGQASAVARRIGEAVRDARQHLGLRQDEVALAAGVSTRVIHQIERGKPTSRLDSVVPVLESLGLTLHVLDRPPLRLAQRTTTARKPRNGLDSGESDG